MEQINQLWNYAHTILGTCVVGFIFLAKWLRDMSKEVERATSVHRNIKEIVISMKKIEVSLIGDYDTKGLLTKYHELAGKVDTLHTRFDEHLKGDN